MRKLFIIALAGVLAAFASARPDRNAFLNVRAGNLKQLIAQVKRDPEVKDRFKRHFGMTDSELTSYLGHLHAERLPSKRTYIVYSAPPDGQIKAHVEIFHPGTPVYSDVTGTPILIAKCGNPLHFGPKSNVARNEVETPIAEILKSERPLDTEIGPSEELITANTIMVPENPFEPVETIGGSPVVIPSPAVLPLFSPWLLGILGLGVLGIDIADDNGGGDNLVPEPASIVLVGMGVLGLLRRRRKLLLRGASV